MVRNEAPFARNAAMSSRTTSSRETRDFALRPGVRETLAELRARGLHLGMVSNIDDDQLSVLKDLPG